MALDDKLDDTLDLEDQNTETDLDDSNQEPEETTEEDVSEDSTDESGETEQSDEVDIDKYDLDSLSDKQLTEFIETGKLPEGIKEKTVAKPTVEPTAEKKPEKSTNSKGKEDKSEMKAPAKAGEQQKPDSDIDYKAFYDKLMGGFKANGTVIKPKSAEDLVSLAQKGLNYTKKMQAMVPMRQVIDSLNNAEIDAEKLNFLIDVHKGDKEAIKKLLQTHKVDPMDLDLDTTNYVAKNNMVSRASAEYSTALEDIREYLPKVHEIINKQWDQQSKEYVLGDRAVLRAVAKEIELGRFDEIQSELESEKTFGRYDGVPDIQAYRDILLKKIEEQQKKTTLPSISKPNTPKQVIPDKKAAAPTKGKVGATSKPNITKKDIFDMNEDDFNKYLAGNLD